MSAQVYNFRVADDKGVQESLTDAANYDFDEVLIVGVKGNQVHASLSAVDSTVTCMGLLAYLQHLMYNRMSGIE